MLERLVREDVLTEVQAAQLLRLWDDGRIGPDNLPLSPAEGAVRLSRDDAVRAMHNLLSRPEVAASIGYAFAQTSAEGVTAQQMSTVLGRLSEARRDRMAQDVIDIFHEEAEERASRYLLSDRYDDGMRRWHTAMREAVRDDLLRMAELGKGDVLDEQDLNRLAGVMREQEGYLQRFAEEVKAREIMAENAETIARREAQQGAEEWTEEMIEERIATLRSQPMSEAQIKQRARMYAGHGRTEYWEARSEEQGEGMVAHYVSQDDDGTCSRCVAAEQNGPYPAGSGHPVPGSATCLGRGACRCRLRFSYDPELYEQLVA